MSEIGERLATLETKLDNVNNSINEMKAFWKDHICNCHNQVSNCSVKLENMNKDIEKNNMFRDITLKIITGSGVLSSICFLIWLGFKEHIK
jgi:hypothetical protein